jgi:hypothetical protein
MLNDKPYLSSINFESVLDKITKLNNKNDIENVIFSFLDSVPIPKPVVTEVVKTAVSSSTAEIVVTYIAYGVAIGIFAFIAYCIIAGVGNGNNGDTNINPDIGSGNNGDTNINPGIGSGNNDVNIIHGNNTDTLNENISNIRPVSIEQIRLNEFLKTGTTDEDMANLKELFSENKLLFREMFDLTTEDSVTRELVYEVYERYFDYECRLERGQVEVNPVKPKD